VTGALKEVPEWLDDSLADGGFIIVPLGGEVNQRLTKRERQGEQLHDTELGSVVFGPVDIKDSEPGLPSPDALADILEEAASFARLYDVIEVEMIEKMENLVVDLRSLPAELPPPDLIELGDAVDDDEPQHPFLTMLNDAQDWLMGLWPLLSQMFNVRLQRPGAPEDEPGAAGFSGGHEDLVP